MLIAGCFIVGTILCCNAFGFVGGVGLGLLAWWSRSDKHIF